MNRTAVTAAAQLNDLVSINFEGRDHIGTVTNVQDFGSIVMVGIAIDDKVDDDKSLVTVALTR